MNTSDRFLRFAAECEVMAKLSRTPENRAVWSGLAERWIRCAKFMDRQDSESHSRRFLKRHPKAVRVTCLIRRGAHVVPLCNGLAQ
jgi:hypothetical protein